MKDHQFSIPQTRLILMGLCLVAMQVLFYAAGVATGVMISPGERLPQKEILAKALVAPAIPKIEAPKIEPPKVEPVKVELAKSEPARAVPEMAAATAPETPAAGTQAEKAAAPAAATASTSSQREEDETRVLAIQVASFHTRDGAQNFAEVLRRSGFSPVVVGEQDHADEIWHYVRLGPYRDWDEAARISAEVDRSYDLHTYIRLVRLTN